jgi:hypothetical protein
MAGLRPGHPRLGDLKKDVDARHKAGHDEFSANTRGPKLNRHSGFTLRVPSDVQLHIGE